ncbi:uncharacterized protein MAM_04577 [Metarhizium album ARSEF 1941]|uniref:Uncharacterized protein n=1 Tax=Metarhizium album (strain ARSEF 1941) TaxID=1081103 RepID=A0A0B2WVS9_METAS|nr:uncharacterized protein MAM_04577 [Metarhizium album ARSEF 1941]KHN97562.1 hypothetical protein MAM_04577 [Metarhizium album ARSEF 1941]
MAPSPTMYRAAETLTATTMCTATAGPGTSVRDGGIGAAVGATVGILFGAVAAWFHLAQQRRRHENKNAETTRDDAPARDDAAESDADSEILWYEGQDEIVKFPPRERWRKRAFKCLMTKYELLDEGEDDLELKLGMQCAGVGTIVDDESNYHVDHVSSVPDSWHESLRRLGLGESLNDSLTDLLMDPVTRRQAIFHLIVRVVFTNLDYHTIGPFSLLPAYVNDFVQSLTPGTDDPWNHGKCFLASASRLNSANGS